MSLATLTGSKISVIEPDGSTVIQFPSTEAALSALVKHQWSAFAALDRYTVLFQHVGDNTLDYIMQLQMAARLVEHMASRRALARLSLPDETRPESSSTTFIHREPAP